jgi:hypothetical protein
MATSFGKQRTIRRASRNLVRNPRLQTRNRPPLRPLSPSPALPLGLQPSFDVSTGIGTFAHPLNFPSLHTMNGHISRVSTALAALVFLSLPTIVSAQSAKWAIGPSLGMSGGMDTRDYHVGNVKRAIGFGFAGSVDAMFVLNPDLAIVTGVGYQQLAFANDFTKYRVNETGTSNDEMEIPGGSVTRSSTYSYVDLAVMLKVSVLLVGFNVGLPMGVTQSSTGAHPEVWDKFFPTSKDSLGLLFEARIGASIPVVKSHAVDLSANILFGYPFTTYSKSDYDLYLKTVTDNSHIPNFRLGVSCLFNMY